MLMTDDHILNSAIRDPPSHYEEEGQEREQRDSPEAPDLSRHEEREQEERQSQDGEGLIDEKYMKYKSKIYLVKVSGERLNYLAAENPSNEQKLTAFQQLVDELSAPFTITRRHLTRLTYPAEISLLKYYQDDQLRTPERPHRGWCLDLKVLICEGKHHQIRRMVQRSQLRVMTLCRISLAAILRIESVPLPGDCRWLDEWEVDELYDALKVNNRVEQRTFNEAKHSGRKVSDRY